ncbi:MAG: cytochrome c [Alphaproteobacteria bacterium]
MSKFWSRMALVAAAGGVAALVAGGALAAAHADSERVKAMKALGGHMGAIGKVAKGEMEYSAETVTHAEGLEKMSKQLIDWFPEGSGGENTRAKPEIWTDWDTFKQKAMDFEAATPALVAAAKTGDRAQIGAALGAVGKTCGGCHKPFRTPKE